MINYQEDYSTISGGANNFLDASDSNISGGAGNAILWAGPSSGHSIGGGKGNIIQSPTYCCTISGGSGNHASYGGYSAVGGGQGNSVNSSWGGGFATVSGGQSNSVTGDFGTIPGGANNVAANYAFAAGYRAKAMHQGAFVWADSTDADFASTGNDQFLIRATGGVGIGTTNPVAQLDVRANGSFGNAFIPTASNASNVLNLQVGLSTNGWQNGITFCEDASGTGMKLGYDGVGLGATNKLVIYDINNVLRFVFESGGNLGLGVYEPGSPIQHSSGAQLTAGGVWQNASDANRKTDFRQVNPEEVLARLARLPVQSWRYTNEVSSVRHMGPTAQDFKAAFGLGTDEKSIGTLDADGVALAAIQGLDQKVEEQLKAKDAEIEELKQSVAELKALVNTLAQKPNGGGE